MFQRNHYIITSSFLSKYAPHTILKYNYHIGQVIGTPKDTGGFIGETEKDMSVNSYVYQQSKTAYHQVQDRMGLQRTGHTKGSV